MDPNNNCYNYATGWMNGGFTQPGQFKFPDTPFLPCDAPEDLKYLLKLDGIRECQKNDKVADGEVKIALFTQENNTSFHFYRQEKDLSWSHKMGPGDVSYVDVDNQKILDPEKCNRNYSHGHYSQLIGYFLVGKKPEPYFLQRRKQKIELEGNSSIIGSVLGLGVMLLGVFLATKVRIGNFD